MITIPGGVRHYLDCTWCKDVHVASIRCTCSKDCGVGWCPVADTALAASRSGP